MTRISQASFTSRGLLYASLTRRVRSGVRLLVFHMGTRGSPLGEAIQRTLYTS